MCNKAEEKSKVVCKVCGSELEFVKKNHYVVADNLKTGVLVTLAATEEQWYDAFDCSVCGCQYIAGERKRKVRNVIFRELQEDLVSDNVIEEDSFDVLDEQKKEEVYDIIPNHVPSCFGKELSEADEECIACECLGSCLSAPECFGTRDGIKFTNEICCKCNVNVKRKCSQIYNKIMKEEGLLKEFLESKQNKEFCGSEPTMIEKVVGSAKEQDKIKAYPICIGDQSLIEENGEECRTCASRKECIRRINEAHEQKEEIWEESMEFQNEF